LQLHRVGEGDEAHGVALPREQGGEGGGGQNAELELVVARRGVVHARADVEQQVGPEVGFLLVALHKQLVGAGEHLPVDVAGAFAGVVQAVLRKLDREPVVGRLVQARDEAIDELAGEEFEVLEGADGGEVKRHRQGFWEYKVRKAALASAAGAPAAGPGPGY
jgi:hypothetical protein